MSKENDLTFLRSYHEHVVAQRGADNLYAKLVHRAITLIDKGVNTNCAFDKVEKIAERIKRKQS